jgi:hypothetical protein
VRRALSEDAPQIRLAEADIVGLDQQFFDAVDEFAARLLFARIVELDQVRRVAVGAEREIVFEQVEQPAPIVLMPPGREAIERALPLPLIGAVRLKHLDQSGAQAIAAHRDEMVACFCGRRRGRRHGAGCPPAV